MDITKGMQELSALFKGKDWFYDVGTDQYGRLVVYVNWNSEEILRAVPDTAGGVQVLVHFVSSKTARREDFASTPADQSSAPVADVTHEAEYLGEDDLEELPSSMISDIGALARELDRLERACGSNILQDIFYEVHDGAHAVTNVSGKYPEVRMSMEKLYKEYGFDIIYEELDG